MLTYWLSVPAEREGSILYMSNRPTMGWSIILIGSTAAFAYNMSIYNFTKLASAVAVMVTTNLLKVCCRSARSGSSTARLPIVACSARLRPLHSRVPCAGSLDYGSCSFRGHPRSSQLDRDINILRRGHRLRLLDVPGQTGGEECPVNSRGQANRNQQPGVQVTLPIQPPGYVFVEVFGDGGCV